MSTDAKSQSWTNQKFNPTNSPAVKMFLEAMEEGREGDAMELLNDGEVLILSKEYIAGYRDSNMRLTKALEEVRTDRDTLLESLYGIWQNMGFILKAIKDDSEVSSGKVKLTGVFLRNVVGFKELSNETVAVIYSVINAAKDNLPKSMHYFSAHSPQFIDSLRILIKYEIISEIDLPEGLLDEQKLLEQ